eukprot:CAMPEP_0195031154 /NCGR_PEP_ID=MMETSP0326_2-20130528/60532_1 /TAXON_ID=2866 ORGANISM="Crypthecodinium cohnii, Strain Seligo" /NCGR_SAMPLE_ID=MMETSP0326_2 /ASSEMBLY_ACC=CAM_ASM_000348 /LENGTH=192 /DNA_ID=CAMNT_0040054733 /DNA_START=179 /DNA_END=757 /DNA_ORIENTATION=+
MAVRSPAAMCARLKWISSFVPIAFVLAAAAKPMAAPFRRKQHVAGEDNREDRHDHGDHPNCSAKERRGVHGALRIRRERGHVRAGEADSVVSDVKVRVERSHECHAKNQRNRLRRTSPLQRWHTSGPAIHGVHGFEDVLIGGHAERELLVIFVDDVDDQGRYPAQVVRGRAVASYDLLFGKFAAIRKSPLQL